MKIYKLYAENRLTGNEKLDSSSDKDKIFKAAEKLNYKNYYSYLIIEHDTELDMDSVLKQKTLGTECSVEYSDNVKSKVEVKAVVFKPTRMKKKEELRKLTEKYIER